jgi:hypothetical protein
LLSCGHSWSIIQNGSSGPVLRIAKISEQISQHAAEDN